MLLRLQIKNTQMPELIEHIDAIARQKQRAVLYLEFHRDASDEARSAAELVRATGLRAQ